MKYYAEQKITIISMDAAYKNNINLIDVPKSPLFM